MSQSASCFSSAAGGHRPTQTDVLSRPAASAEAADGRIMGGDVVVMSFHEVLYDRTRWPVAADGTNTTSVDLVRPCIFGAVEEKTLAVKKTVLKRFLADPGGGEETVDEY